VSLLSAISVRPIFDQFLEHVFLVSLLASVAFIGENVEYFCFEKLFLKATIFGKMFLSGKLFAISLMNSFFFVAGGKRVIISSTICSGLSKIKLKISYTAISHEKV